MSRFQYKLPVILMIVMLVFGLALCKSMCACEDDGPSDHVSTDGCCAVCLCQSLALLPAGIDPATEATGQEFDSGRMTLRLPLVLTAIFNPPRG